MSDDRNLIDENGNYTGHKNRRNDEVQFKDGKPYVRARHSLTDEQRAQYRERLAKVREETRKREDNPYFKKKGDKKSDAQREKARKSKMENIKKRKSMQKALSDLLTLEMGKGQLMDAEDVQYFFDLAGKNTNVETALLISQINNALAGDTKAFKVLAEVLGETAQKVEVDLKADNKNKLDSILTQTTSHQTYDEEDLKAMEDMEDDDEDNDNNE